MSVHLQILTGSMHKQPHTHTAGRPLSGDPVFLFSPREKGAWSRFPRSQRLQPTRPLGKTGPGHPWRQSGGPLFLCRVQEEAGQSHWLSALLSGSLGPTNPTGGGAGTRDGGMEIMSREQLAPRGKLELRHPRELSPHLALQSHFPLPFLTHPPGSLHFSLCSRSCPSPLRLGMACTWGCVLHAHL